ncbi:hypothetical protein HDU91_004611, partial [Kappamyces sp. JEL0680]
MEGMAPLNLVGKAGSNKAATCLSSLKVLAMGVAADCSYVTAKGGIQNALSAILENWNSASKVYESTFNVQLGVAKVLLQESCNSPASVTSLPWNQDCTNPAYTIQNRLSDFSQWRGTQQDGMGLWHLMTKCNTQPAVGIAWVSQLCTTSANAQNTGSGNQIVSGTGVSSITPVEWKVVAHEIGHGFGAIHDCTSSFCTSACTSCSPNCDCGGTYLMNPLDNASSGDFSPGSIQLICNGIQTQGAQCLKNPGELQFVNAGICGNGVKEGNEQCDCGLPNSTACQNDPCCDGATCT